MLVSAHAASNCNRLLDELFKRMKSKEGEESNEWGWAGNIEKRTVKIQ